MLSDFAASHPHLFGILLWPCITALVTGLFGLLGHLSADDYAKLPAPLAAALRLFSAAGFDAPAALKLLARAFGKVPPVAVLLLALTGCAFLQSPNGTATVVLGVKDAICVIDHADQPILTIIKDCHLAEDAAQAVMDILAAEQRAGAKRAAACKLQVIGSEKVLDAGADR